MILINRFTVGRFTPIKKFNMWCSAAGYFSNAEATANTLDSEGWLRTGDLCYIDDDGFIFVVDRLKELIKYKGYQVREFTTLIFQVQLVFHD